MRVGVLEWICGGGLLLTPLNEVSPSLLREGWLMLKHLTTDLLDVGLATIVSVDSRCIPDKAAFSDSRAEVIPINSANNFEELLDLWCGSFAQVDALIVIAPECDGVLEKLLATLRSAGVNCANCRGNFLKNSADKLLTAFALERAEIPHPATMRLKSVDTSWLAKHEHRSGRWALKPRDGAGCENLHRLTTSQLREILSKGIFDDERTIVQPWLDGIACSRSAIVDASGCCHWMPLVSQQISVDRFPKYDGGQVQIGRIDELKNRSNDDQKSQLSSVTLADIDQLNLLLDRAVKAIGHGALAWIGVDLLFHPERADDRFTIIEFNPRLTTSFIGLRQSCDGSLSEQMLKAALGSLVCLPSFLRSTKFSTSQAVGQK